MYVALRISLTALAVVSTGGARVWACDRCKCGVPSRVHVERSPWSPRLTPQPPTSQPGSTQPSTTQTSLRGTGNGAFLEAGQFHFDFTTGNRKWKVIDPLQVTLLRRPGQHLHDFSREWWYHLSLTYGAADDLELSVSAAFHDLRSVFTDDGRPAFVGSHDADSAGPGDVELGVRWRLLRDPLEFYLIGGVGSGRPWASRSATPTPRPPPRRPPGGRGPVA